MEAPYKLEPNPIIAQLRKELAEARENELTALDLHHPNGALKWIGYQDGLRRAIEIVQRERGSGE